MPNWCEHDITVSGPKADMGRFMDIINGATGPEGVSLLSVFLPRPEALENTVSPERMPHRDEEIEQAQAEEAARMRAANSAWETRRDELIEAHGSSNWYDWSIQTWGVKWPDRSRVVRCGPRSVTLSGQCPWGPPIEGISGISKMFPRLRFTIEWFEGGMQFAGKASYLDGAELSMTQRPYRGWRGG